MQNAIIVSPFQCVWLMKSSNTRNIRDLRDQNKGGDK